MIVLSSIKCRKKAIFINEFQLVVITGYIVKYFEVKMVIYKLKFLWCLYVVDEGNIVGIIGGG